MNEQFGVGTVLGTGFRVWAKNLIPFTFITALIYVPVIILAVVFFNGSHTDKDLIVYALTVFGLTVVLNSFVTATITYGVIKELQGQRASIGACIGTGFARMMPALGVAILAGIAIIGGCLLLIIPGIIVACMLYVAIPASVIEKPGVMGALKRSRELTVGHKGQVFGILFLMGIIGWAEGKIQAAVINPHDMASIKLNMYVSLGAQILIGSLTAVIVAVAYYYLRNEKEGTSASELASVFE